jgi:hypothetical protein
MRTKILRAVVLAVVFAVFPLTSGAQPQGQTAIIASASATSSAQLPTISNCASDNACSKLSAYVLTAMKKWATNAGAKPSHLDEIANTISEVVLENPRTWHNSNGGREAILMASIAFYESGFADYVDEMKCNDKKWRASSDGKSAMRNGDCDGGIAWGVWQVHMLSRKVKREDITRKLIATHAYRIARGSIISGKGLLYYVGGEGPYRAKIAKQRTDLTDTYYAANPYKPTVNSAASASASAR